MGRSTKNRTAIANRRLGHMGASMAMLKEQKRQLLKLQRKLKNGHATVVVNSDGSATIVEIPYKDFKLPGDKK